MPYLFTQEDFEKFTTDILGAEGDQATLTTIMADMQGTYTDALAATESLKSENERLTAERDRLKSSNMELFLRVGAKARGEEDDSNKSPDHAQTVAEYMNSYFEKLDK